MIDILVVSKNIEYSVELLNNIGSCNSSIRITCITNTLKDMCKFINSNSFDIILFDCNLLPLSKANKYIENFTNKYRDCIIILFDKVDPSKKYSKFNCVFKYDFERLLNKIIELSSQTIESKMIKEKIKNELEFIGYNANHLGTRYIAEIIYLIYRTHFDGSLEKGIYPYIAERFNKTVNTIKCDIINATTLMFCECPEKKLMDYLGQSTCLKPGPKTVIYSVVNKL